jgi:hypothetical protein
MDCRSRSWRWTLSLSHPFQLLRSSSDDVSRTISDSTVAETAPSHSFELLSLLPLSWAFPWDRWRNLEFSHQMMLWWESAPIARGSTVRGSLWLSCAIIRKPRRRKERLAHLNLASRRLNDQRDVRHAGFADVGLYGGGVQDATQFFGLWSLEVERLRGAEPR